MLVRAHLVAVAAVASLASPAAAQTPGPTAFDGRYMGVSIQGTANSGRERARCAPQASAPGPLTITNGVARQALASGWQGTVSPQGGLSMRNAREVHFEGQIDGQGTITGTTAGPICTYTLIWRKQ